MLTQHTLVDIFESVFETKFAPQYINENMITVDSLLALANALDNFYRDCHFTRKIPGELTPYLYPRFPLEIYSQYNFDNTNQCWLIDCLKRPLLYSHRIFIDDILMSNLSDFRINMGHKISIKFKANILHVIKQYAALAPLLQNRIIVPVCLEQSVGCPSPEQLVPTDAEKAGIIRILGRKFPLSGIALMAGIVKEQAWFRSISNGNLDLYFPNKNYVELMNIMLTAEQVRFSSDHIKEPFRVGTVTELKNLNVDSVKLEDIIQIRLGEESFAKLRGVLRDIFEKIEYNEGVFSDIDTEFYAIAKDRCRQKKAELEAAAKKSSPLAALLDSADKIALGVVLGLYTGHPLAGAIAGAVKPLYDILRSTSHSKEREISSLRCHYLALSSSAP